jgi:hypothetical protein
MYKYTVTGDYIIKKNVEKFTKVSSINRNIPLQKTEIYGQNYDQLKELSYQNYDKLERKIQKSNHKVLL